MNSEVLKTKDFQFFSQCIFEHAGIHMPASKVNLIQTRLKRRLRELELPDFKAYRKTLESLPKNHPEWKQFVNALTTNKTDFFREPKHFEHLLNNIQQYKEPLKIWSAACSSGEEPYSLAICLERLVQYELLATDLDTDILARAQKGVYEAEKVKTQLRAQDQKDHFMFGTGEIRNWAKVKPHLKKNIEFKCFNLISSPISKKNYYHIIFLRNVLIYFDKDTISRVIQRMHESLAPGGYLYIGHSESLTGIDHPFESVQPSIYRRRG